MDPQEAEKLCDELAELASSGPSKNPQALVRARTILREITQSGGATTYIRERATTVDRALSGWFDSEERFHAVLKSHSAEIYAMIDQLHSALREAARFKTR